MNEIIRQRSSRDCGVCAAAMAIGRPYENVLVLAPFAKSIGMATPEISNALALYGVQHTHITTAEGIREVDSQSGVKRFGITQKLTRTLISATPAILVLLTKAGGFHAVYWADGMVWDPSTGEPKELSDEDIIVEALVIHASTFDNNKENPLDNNAGAFDNKTFSNKI